MSAEDKVLLTLRFYATGSFQNVLGDLPGFDQAPVCRQVSRTTKVIAARFNEFIFMPTIEEQEATNLYYYNIHGIPGIIGNTHSNYFSWWRVQRALPKPKISATAIFHNICIVLNNPELLDIEIDINPLYLDPVPVRRNARQAIQENFVRNQIINQM